MLRCVYCTGMNNLGIEVMTKNIDELILTRGEITLGRSAENTVTLNDHQVSSFHAKITTLFNASFIEDLGSTNGTYVNGKQIKKHTLHHGDMLLIGEHKITVVKPDGMNSN